jgi:hypothetical protein
MSRSASVRAVLAVGALVLLAIAVALPALAASPSGGSGAGTPSASEKPGHGPKGSREPEVAVTLHGLVSATTDADGRTSFTLTADGKTYRLDAGPPWFLGDKNPLAASAGKTVTITGEQSGDEVDVDTVDGSAIREPGRPPWAGGWKAVGSAHPGWSQDKWDHWQQKFGASSGAADCWPPGRCKDHGPEESEEPAPS